MAVALRLARTTVDGFALTPCVYCGLVASTVDHVVPRSYRSMIADWRKQEGWEKIPDTVPCCSQCNSIAGANIFASLKEKREYIKDRLRYKYRRLLASAFWNESEIQGLGKSLRSHIEKAERKKIIVLLRLAWPYDIGNEVEALTRVLAGADNPAPALNSRRRSEILR